VKNLLLFIFLASISSLGWSQTSKIALDGPKYLLADSVGVVKIDVANCKCRGKLSYTMNDSSMMESKKLKVRKSKAELIFNAPSFMGMVGIYFKYQCKKMSYKGAHVFAVGKPYSEPVKIFEMPDKIVAGNTFQIKLLNLEEGKTRLICEECKSIVAQKNNIYHLNVVEPGEYEVYIEELKDGVWDETYSRSFTAE